MSIWMKLFDKINYSALVMIVSGRYWNLVVSFCFFVVYLFYVCWSDGVLFDYPKDSGPLFRIFVTLFWLIPVSIVLAMAWHKDSKDKILVGLIPFVVVPFIFSSGEIEYSVACILGSFVCIYISALSCGIWMSRWASVISWVFLFLFQVLVDLLFWANHLYGNFRFSF